MIGITCAATYADALQYSADISPNNISHDGPNGRPYETFDTSEKHMPSHQIEDDDEDDEDIDNLIEELESQDGDNADYEEEEAQQPGGARLIPEEFLQTNTRTGLTSGEVFLRRKQFGYNQMKGTYSLYHY